MLLYIQKVGVYMFPEKIKELRVENRYTQQDIADKLGITRPAYTAYESGKRQPDFDTLQRIAEIYEVTTDYLLGRSEKKKYYELTNKDEKDISNDLENMINDLTNNGLLYSKDTTELDKETRELLIASLEQSLRIAKMESKKKFTPKKYRD